MQQHIAIEYRIDHVSGEPKSGGLAWLDANHVQNNENNIVLLIAHTILNVH